MRAVIQRVTKSSVDVDGETIGQIDKGLLVFLGVGHEDEKSDVDYLCDKIVNFIERCKEYEEIKKVQSGEFGADMKVDIQNDGPVTILIDSKKEF